MEQSGWLFLHDIMNPNSHPIYSGESRNAMDVKNRITLPAAWRRADPEDFLISIERMGRCLVLMPPEEFEDISQKLAALSDITEEAKREFVRYYYSQTRRATVDRQGRLVLPDDFCRKLNFGAEVMLAGGGTRIEIWNIEPWYAALEELKANNAAISAKLGL